MGRGILYVTLSPTASKALLHTAIQLFNTINTVYSNYMVVSCVQQLCTTLPFYSQ